MNKSLRIDKTLSKINRVFRADSISKNPSITWEIVLANPDKPWNWNCLSENPSIHWEIVLNNPDRPWNWSRLSKNPSMLISEADIKRAKASLIIQKYWRKAISDPHYVVCKKRLLWEFSSIW